MTKQSGLGDNLYVAGVDLSGDINSLQGISGGVAPINVTGIDKSGFERIGGQRDGSIKYKSYFDPTQAHPVLSALPATDQIVTYCRGTVLGSPAASLVGKQLNYDGTLGDDGSFMFDVEVDANGFGLEWGTLLTAGKRTDTAATNGTSVDMTTVSTVFGLQAYLHVFGFTGTSVTVKLQDSADNATFADITGAGFTAATAVGAQRLAISSTGTVRRYIRAVTTGTFSNAVFAVAAVRNLTAVSF